MSLLIFLVSIRLTRIRVMTSSRSLISFRSLPISSEKGTFPLIAALCFELVEEVGDIKEVSNKSELS
jgi:hypothetical protein